MAYFCIKRFSATKIALTNSLPPRHAEATEIFDIAIGEVFENIVKLLV